MFLLCSQPLGFYEQENSIFMIHLLNLFFCAFFFVDYFIYFSPSHRIRQPTLPSVPTSRLLLRCTSLPSTPFSSPLTNTGEVGGVMW